MVMLFGRRPILEILSSRTRIQKILVAEEAHGYTVEQIIKCAKERKISVVKVPKQEIDALFPGKKHQGVVAEAQVPDEPIYTLEKLLQEISQTHSPPFLLILDSIEDPRNLGALIRTANAAGAQGVIIPKYRASGITPAVIKASSGAVASTPIIRVANIVQTCIMLKKNGIWIIGADARGKELWSQIDWTLAVALVLGSEGKGIRRLVREECDFIVRLPMLGKIDSLNVSVAGGILMYEMIRQRMT